MHRIDGYGHKNHRFYSPDEGAIDYDGQTKLTAEWLNSMQEEVCRLLEAFEVKLDKGNEGQVAKLAKDLVTKLEGKINDSISSLSGILSTDIAKSKEELWQLFLAENERQKVDIQSHVDSLHSKITNENEARKKEIQSASASLREYFSTENEARKSDHERVNNMITDKTGKIEKHANLHIAWSKMFVRAINILDNAGLLCDNSNRSYMIDIRPKEKLYPLEF